MQRFSLLWMLVLGLAAALSGQNFHQYEIFDGYAITHGDILLGKAEEVAAKSKTAGGRAAAAIPLRNLRWPNATLFYVIDDGVPNPARILAAIEHWNARSIVHIEPWTGQTNRVRFQRATGVCSSYVGMLGGEQPVLVTDDCPASSLIHEIGHAFGLLHEQERADRDTWVTVLSQNIDPRYLYAFEADQHGAQDLDYYDYDSIMQYGATAFSRGFVDTIETVPVGIPIGQRNGLSAGDLDAVSRMYGIVPSETTITTIPAGLTIVVDGESYTSPHSFPWPADSTQTISVPAQFGNDPRYRFVRWSDGGEATHTVTARSDRTVYAAVYQLLRPVSATVGQGNGTVRLAPPSDDGYYPERLPLRITAEPGPGSTFFNWQGQPGVELYGNGYALETAHVQSATNNTQFRAVFVSSPTVTIDSEPRGLQIRVNGTPYRTPLRLSSTPGTLSLVAMNPQTREGGATILNFASWSDGGAASHDVTMPSGSATFTARYTARHQITVNTTGNGSVTLSPSSPDGFYNEGTEVRLIPRPGAGSVLRYWTGDLAGAGEQTIVMNDPKTVTANFGSPLPFVVYNGASFTLNPLRPIPAASVVPGEMVTLFSDSAIGPPQLVTAQIAGNKLVDNLGGTRILFDGVAAPLVYAAEKQVTAIVPWGVKPPQVAVAIERNGQIAAQQTLIVSASFPAMFTATANGLGQIRALNQDLTINSKDNPVEPGQVIVIYATGSGELNSAVEDGAIADGNLIGVKAPVMVRIGKLPAQVTYAGTAPGIVNGAFQVNAVVPKEALSDPAAPIQLIVGHAASPPGTTIAIR